MTESSGIKPSPWATFRDLGLSALLARGGAPSEKDLKAAEDAATYAEAGVYYRRLAAQGDPVAQYELAVMYDFGRGVRRDPARAVRLYRLAAEAGHLDATFDLAMSLQAGDGAPKDEAAAIELFREAADAGHPRAQNTLGSMLRLGQGLPADPEAAVRYYRMAADQGWANARINLAAMLESGSGCEQDIPAATALYWAVGRQGRSDAILALANLHLTEAAEGMTVPAGLRLLARAALMDNFDAMAMGAALYISGDKCPADDVKAFGWLALTLAAHLEDPAQDIVKIVETMEVLRRRMSPEDLDQARRFVLKRRGVDELLVLFWFYARWLARNDPSRSDYMEEAERWLDLAAAYGSGTRRYVGMMRTDAPQWYEVPRGPKRFLVGRRMYSQAQGFD